MLLQRTLAARPRTLMPGRVGYDRDRSDRSDTVNPECGMRTGGDVTGKPHNKPDTRSWLAGFQNRVAARVDYER